MTWLWTPRQELCRRRWVLIFVLWASSFGLEFFLRTGASAVNVIVEETETPVTRKRSLISLFMESAVLLLAGDNEEEDPLVHWLDRLRVDIPDESFSAKLVTVHIEGLHCTHFSVQHVDSDLLPQQHDPNFNTNHTLQLQVRQVAAACQGNYRATGGASGTVNAQLTTTTTTTDDNPVAIAWVVAVRDNPNTTVDAFREPAWVETQECETALQVTGLHFSGSLSAKLMDLFRESIESHANGAIQQQICPVIRHQLDPLLTTYLVRALQWLRPYYSKSMENITTQTETKIRMLDEFRFANFLADESPTKEHHPDDNETPALIDFDRDLPIFTSALRSTNLLVEKYLNRGLLSLPTNNISTSTSAAPHRERVMDDKCGGFLLHGVNGILRDLLQWVSEDESWILPIPPIHWQLVWPQYAAIDLHMDRVTIAGEGLYQWTNVTLLRPYKEQSSLPFFQTALETPGNLSIAVHMVVNVSSIPGSMFQSEHPLIESFVVQVNTTSLNAVLNLAVELQRQRFEYVTVAMLVNALFPTLWSPLVVATTPADATCLLDSIQNLTVQGLSASVNLSHFSILPAAASQIRKSDQLEQDLDTLISNIVQLFLRGYQPLVSASIKGLVQGPAQQLLKEFLESITATDYSNSSTTNCTADRDSENPHWVNFTDFPTLRNWNALLNDPITLSKINQYVDCTADLFNRVVAETLVNETASSNSSESSSLSLRSLRIDHPGNIRLMEFLAPVRDGKHLESGLSILSNNSDLQSQISVSFDLYYKPLDLVAKIDTTVYLDEIDWVGGSLLHLNSNVFRRTSLMELFSHGQCFLAPADQVELYNTKTRLGDFHVLVSASFSTISLSEPGDEVAQLIAFDSKKYPAIQSTASNVFVWLVNILQDVANGFLRAGVAQAPGQCNSESNKSSSDNEEEESIGFDMNTLFLILAAIYIFLQPTILLMRRPREPAGPEQGSSPQDERDLREPLLHPRYSDEIVQAHNSSIRKPSSLMFHPRVPIVARHLVPISILLTIAMLLASNMSTGASVIAIISQTERTVRLPSLFDFGLYNTAKDMLQAKIYPLFLLVVGFSGIWPYAKLFLMLVAWATPESVLTKDTRGALLLKLDALSKFSLVDTYVLVVMLVAFRFHVELINDAVLDVYVAPKTGFYGFLVATSASLVIGHILVYYNRRAEVHLEFDDESRDSVFSHEFILSDGSQRRLSETFKRLLVVILFTTFVLLGFGISQHSFRFEFGGLAGLVLGDDRVTSYSLLTLGAAIPKSIEKPPGAAVYILQAAFYFYAVVTPFAALFFLLLALVCPLTQRRQCQIITLAEIANAWSAIEVFAMSIIAALLEISTFASFIIGSRCDMIDEILKDFDTGDVDSCYTVKSTVTWRSMFLVLGVILNSGWVSFVLQLVHLSFHERIQGGFNRHSPSVVQRLVGWKPTSWIVESENEEGNDDDASAPVFTEQTMIPETVEEEACGFDEESKDVT